jgi:hypothetical protein
MDIQQFIKYEPVPGAPQCRRRVRSYPMYWVELAPGRMEGMYHDEYVAMTAAEEAAKNAQRAARELELAASRPSPGESSQLATLTADPASTETAIMPARSSHIPDLSRHSRRCSICAHPDRDAIEAEFIRWRSPEKIAKDYNLGSRLAIYRHAHAAGLLDQRRRHVSRVLESFLETVDDCPPLDFDPITRAVRVYAHLDDNGRWIEPDRTLRILTSPATSTLEP